MSDKSTKKNESLQALKGYAFLGIFLLHIGIGQMGACGVTVFLVMSGFLSFYAYQDRTLSCSIGDNIRFALRKIKKLYPLHLLMLFFTVIIMKYEYNVPFTRSRIAIEIVKILMNALLLQAWIPGVGFYFSFNGVSWYLSVYLMAMFCFPFILRRLKRYKSRRAAYQDITVIIMLRLLLAVVFAMISPLPVVSDDFAKWLFYVSPPVRLGDFYAGCILGYLFFNAGKQWEISSFKAGLAEAFTLALLAGTQYIYQYQVGILGRDEIRYSLLFVPVSMLLVALFSMKRGVFTGLLSNRVSVFLGNISPVCFLIHQVVIRYSYLITEYFMPVEMSLWRRMIICLGMTVFLSILWQLPYRTQRLVCSK